jgi:prephenate dehydrogenase
LTLQTKFPRLALLGVGYIGGSAALAARRARLIDYIVGFDVDPSATSAGVRKGVIDAVAATAKEAVSGSSLVLVAAPVRSVETLLADIAESLPSDATVIDVGSVKSAILSAAERSLPSGQFVGCHPMAGAEFVGVDAASADIYPGRVCFICPSGRTRPSATESAHDFWSGIGCRTVDIDADTHDRLMAAQSHLPHVAAFALAAALAPSLSFLGSHTSAGSPTTSLRDTTRIAASSPAVWRDILQANACNILPLIEELERCVKEIKNAVVAADGEALERVLALGRSCRQRLVKE